MTDKLVQYTNKLYHTISDPENPSVIRDHIWTYTIECDVIQNEVTSSHVHHQVESHSSVIVGHHDINMAFYKDASFHEEIPGNPLVVNVGDLVYVKVYTSEPDWTVKMKLHTCFTSPSSQTSDLTRYYLIKEG